MPRLGRGYPRRPFIERPMEPPPPVIPKTVRYIVLEPVVGSTESQVLGRDGDTVYMAFEAVQGRTDMSLAPEGNKALLFDTVEGSTNSTLGYFIGRKPMYFDDVEGGTLSYMTYTPDLSDNPPIFMAVQLQGQIVLIPPPPEMS